MFGIKQTDSKSSKWMMFNTDRTNHCVMRKAEEGMAIVTNRGTSQTRTTSNCRKMNTKCNFMNVKNINMAMIEFFFL